MEHIRQNVIKYMDIDTKRAMGLPPGKIDPARAERLWYLLKSHDGIIYNLNSKSLHIFHDGYHVIKRPLEYNNLTNVFNENFENYTMEITSPTGVYINFPHHGEPVYTNLRILLRGSSLI